MQIILNSSFLLQDIPTHPDTRLFEVREAFKRIMLLGFRAYIRAYIAFFPPPATLRVPSGGPPWGTSGELAHLRRVLMPCSVSTN